MTTIAVQPFVLPQWSPVVTTGTTITSAGLVARVNEPQWSPVVTTGTTRVRRWRPRLLDAAMEPRRDDGDDPGPADDELDALLAAMEPRRDDGDDSPWSSTSASKTWPPQWSPVVTTGTTPETTEYTPAATVSRHGAPS